MKRMLAAFISMALLIAMIILSCLPAAAQTAQTVIYDSVFQPTYGTIRPMYHYYYNTETGEFTYQGIFDYTLYLRSSGEQVMFNMSSSITLSAADGQAVSYVFVPLDFFSGDWSGDGQHGDTLNRLTFPLIARVLADYDIGIATVDFDGYNLTTELFNSIVWAGEASIEANHIHEFNIEGVIENPYWLVVRIVPYSSELVVSDYFFGYEVGTVIATFSRPPTVDEQIVAGIGSINDKLDNGFQEIQLGQEQINNTLTDIKDSFAPIEVDPSIGDIMTSDQEFRDFLNNRLSELDDQAEGIFLQGNTIMSDIQSGIQFWGVMFSLLLSEVPLLNNGLWIFAAFSVVSLLFGSAVVSLGSSAVRDYTNSASSRESKRRDDEFMEVWHRVVYRSYSK